jgi:hypothetical protein
MHFAAQLLLGLSILFSWNTQANAQIAGWERVTGPHGGSIRHLFAFDGMVMADLTRTPAFYRSDALTDQWFGSVGLPFNQYSVAFLRVSTGVYLSAGERGMYRTTDFGATWTQIMTLRTRGMAAIGAVVYILSPTNSVFRSLDGGLSWHYHSEAGAGSVYGMVSVSDSALLVWTSAGMRISEDGALTWQPLSHGLGNRTITAISSADGKAYVIASKQLFVLNDVRTEWTGLGVVSNRDNYVLAHGDNGLIYAAGSRTVNRSEDGGATWVQVNGDAPETRSILWLGEGVLYAATTTGVQRSDDSGISFRRVGLPASNVQSMSQGDWLHAGTESDGLHVSKDAGHTWDRMSTDIQSIEFLVAHPDDLMYAIAHRGAGSSRGIYRSDDGGTSWVLLRSIVRPGGLVSPLPGIIFALSGGSGKPVLRSFDGGETWEEFDAENIWALSLTMAPNGYLYMGDWGRIHRSIDRGETWTGIDVNGYFTHLATTEDGTVYAGSQGGGLFRSADNGETWDLTPLGFNHHVNGLATGPDNLVVTATNLSGSYTQQVSYSIDGGESWTTVEGHFEFERIVASMQVLPSRHVLVGTARNSIYRSLLPVGTGYISSELPFGEFDMAVYPNPTRSDITVKIVAPRPQSVAISVTDLLGRRHIDTREQVPAGTYQLPVRLDGLPSGTYIVVVHGENFHEQRRLVRLR